MQLFIGILACLVASLTHALSEQGEENCPNKCDKVFDRTQYAISNINTSFTFEYQSCLIGCSQCQTELNTGTTNDTCFVFCKNFDYGKAGIRKGVIEPDKACLMGCVINLCQDICIGGTTDPKVTPQNAQFFWGQGGVGCSIKTGLGYVQNPSYGNPNGPSGEGGSAKVAQCCSNAFNLCFYNGPTTTTNYANVLLVAQRTCSSFVSSTDTSSICNFYNNPQNCGTQGLLGALALPGAIVT